MATPCGKKARKALDHGKGTISTAEVKRMYRTGGRYFERPGVNGGRTRAQKVAAREAQSKRKG